jgi:hypothetical protein
MRTLLVLGLSQLGLSECSALLACCAEVLACHGCAPIPVLSPCFKGFSYPGARTVL